MPPGISAIQSALAAEGIDGWLFYDFRGSDPIGRRLLGLGERLATRRWFYLVPLRGEPRMTSATYRAEEFTVTVSVHEDPKGPDVRIVSGVVTPVDVSHGGRALLTGPAHTAQTQVDTAGQFAFDGVPVGQYTLELQLGDTTVQVSPLEVA